VSYRPIFGWFCCMAEPRQIRNLALIGFMGTGKSSTGQILAHQLGFRFLDTDALIEERAGVSISEIFEKSGEAAFRELEGRIVEELASHSETIISTGGGLGANEAHLESLKTHALVACLWAGPEAIWQRVRHQSHRPLLSGPDAQDRIREMLKQRESAYRRADILINTEMRSVKDVAQQLLYHFQEARGVS